MSSDEPTPDIPEEFWSEYSEQPFDACIECEKPLSGKDVPYVIQKHVVAGETVFELAICVECASRLNAEFSIESRQNLMESIAAAPERRRREEEAAADEELPLLDDQPLDEQLADMHAHLEELSSRRSIRRERALSCCAICAKPRTECHRYSLGTACLGLTILSAAPDSHDLGSPFLICDDCERELNECISRQTRNAWDRFVEDNFDDGPPGLSVDPRELVAIF